MQTTQSTSRSKFLGSVLFAFFLGGLCSGLLFTWLVTRPYLQRLWFRTQEFWVLPTFKLWLLTVLMFIVGLALGYVLSHWRGFITFPVPRLLFGLILLATSALLPFLSIAPSASITQFLLTRLSLALVLSLALFTVTRRYYVLVAIFMLVVIVVAPLIASVPDGFFQFPNEWFEALKFVIAATLLSILSGYWLIISKAERIFD